MRTVTLVAELQQGYEIGSDVTLRSKSWVELFISVLESVLVLKPHNPKGHHHLHRGLGVSCVRTPSMVVVDTAVWGKCILVLFFIG